MEKQLIIKSINAGDESVIYYCPVIPAGEVMSENIEIDIPEKYCEKRKNEILTIQYIISCATDYKGIVKYESDGKPLLPGFGKYISISHSAYYAAVLVSEFPCGVDVEKISERPAKIAHKFLNENERNMIEKSQSDFYHTLLWSAKESLFKITGEPDFLTEIRTISLPLAEESFFDAEVLSGKKVRKFRIFFTTFDEHVLTWTYEKQPVQ